MATRFSAGESWLELTPAEVTEFSIQNVGRPDGELKWSPTAPASSDTGYLIVRGDAGSHENMTGSGKVYGKLSGTKRNDNAEFETG